MTNPAMSLGEFILHKLLADLLKEVDRNICTHEETHRGGAIWTICDHCDKEWADDRGGFKPYVDHPAIAAAREFLAASTEWRDEQNQSGVPRQVNDLGGIRSGVCAVPVMQQVEASPEVSTICTECGGDGWAKTSWSDQYMPCPSCTTRVLSATKPDLTDAQIRTAFLANGFKIKEGRDDLMPYVYEAARAILKLQAEA